VGIVIGAFLIGFESQIVHYLTSTSEVAFYQLYAIYIIIDFNTWLTPILLLRGDNKKTLTLYTIVVNTLWVMVVTLPVILNFNPQWIFIGLIGISVFKQFFLIVLIIQHADCTIDWNIGREWLRKSIPFIGYALLGGFHLIADNWMVGHYFPRDKEIFAIFRYGARELPFSIIIATAFSTAIVPVLQKENTYGLKTFKKKWKKLSSILILLAFFALVFSKKIFLIVYGAEFELSAEIFSIYILVILSRILILKPLIMTQNLNHWLVPIAISELIVNVSLSYLLVPIFGLSGIAWGTVIAYSYEKIFMILLLKIKNKLSPVQYLSIPHFTLYAVIIIICFVLV
jgi:O-antigen/teichoic acid export membrane protein